MVGTDILQSLAFPDMFDRRNNIEQHHPFTCRWIFSHDHYLSWKEARRGLLWIKGKPGSGKSTLMTALREDVKERRHMEEGVVYLDFYFSARGSELQRTAPGMYRSLLNQLFIQSKPARVVIRAHYKEKYTAFGGANTELKWHRAELERLLARAVLETAKQQPIEIFVDALDEAGRHEAQELVTYFHNLCNNGVPSVGNVKICISCRHYPVAATKDSSEIWVEKYNHDDISRFVNDTFIRMNLVFEEDSAELKEWSQLQEEIIRRAKGVFQWVRLVLQLVQTSFDDGHPAEYVRRRTNEVPQELSDVYEYIIKNVIDPQSWAKSFSLFRWVCLGAHPLSLTQMRYALAAEKIPTASTEIQIEDIEGFIQTDRQMEKQVVAISGGLLEVVSGYLPSRIGRHPEAMLIQVTHQTVDDYLSARGLHLLGVLQGKILHRVSDRTWADDRRSIIEYCHSDLYWTCLTYIAVQSTVLHQEVSKIRDQGIKHNMRIYAATVSPRFPLINYATDYMLMHAKLAGAVRSCNIVDEVSILGKVIPVWAPLLEVLTWNHAESWTCATMKVLHFAAHAGLRDLFKWLLQNDPDVHCMDGRGHSVMTHAAWGGHLLYMQDLYRCGVPLRSTSNTNDNLLTIAAGGRHVDIVKWLLEKDEELINDSGTDTSPLQAASEGGNPEIVLMLLKAGADVNQVGGYYGTALQAASGSGHEKVVKILLDAGANINQIGGSHETALWRAAACGDSNIVKILLDAGADVDKSRMPSPGLYDLIFEGDEQIKEILIDAGADYFRKKAA